MRCFRIWLDVQMRVMFLDLRYQLTILESIHGESAPGSGGERFRLLK